jgi:RNA polymerase sigma factor (TIGR02999 family)
VDGFTEETYARLRAIARHTLGHGRARNSIAASSLVHEAWMRMNRSDSLRGLERKAFIRMCAVMIQRVLVDHFRASGGRPSGGAQQSSQLDDLAAVTTLPPVGLIELERVLVTFAEEYPRAARVVELRFFGGLGLAEIAAELDVARRTVDHDWRFARAWLANQLDGAF